MHSSIRLFQAVQIGNLRSGSGFEGVSDTKMLAAVSRSVRNTVMTVTRWMLTCDSSMHY